MNEDIIPVFGSCLMLFLVWLLVWLLVVRLVGVEPYGFLLGWFQSFGFKEHLSKALAAALMLDLGFTILWTLTLFRDDHMSFGEFVCAVVVILVCLPCFVFLMELLLFLFQGLGLWWPIPYILSLALTVVTVGSLFGALVALLVGWELAFGEAVPDTPKSPPRPLRPTPNSTAVDDMSIIALSWALPQKHSTSRAEEK